MSIKFEQDSKTNLLQRKKSGTQIMLKKNDSINTSLADSK